MHIRAIKMKKIAEKSAFQPEFTPLTKLLDIISISYFKLLIVIPAAIFFIFLNAQAETTEQKRLISSKYGFSALIPLGFEQVENNSPGVALALRNSTKSEKGDTFPTLTLTIHPGSLSPKLGRPKGAKEILESYKSIGIIDASIESETTVNKLGSSLVQATIAYSNLGVQYRSIVTLIPALDHYFILTFIDYPNSIANSQSVVDAFLDSFNPGTLPTPEAKKTPKLRDRIFLLFMSVLGIAGLVGLIWYQCKDKVGDAKP